MEVNPKAIKMGFTGALAIAASLVFQFEGFNNHDYKDPPGINTICYGHSGNVKTGQIANDTQCVTYLNGDLDNANAVLARDVRVPLSDKTRAALLDFVYNAGSGTFERSTLLKMLNQGRYEDACNQLPKFVFSGKIKLNGLVRRREAEKKICLEGLK